MLNLIAKHGIRVQARAFKLNRTVLYTRPGPFERAVVIHDLAWVTKYWPPIEIVYHMPSRVDSPGTLYVGDTGRGDYHLDTLRLRAKDANLTKIECVLYAARFLFFFFFMFGGHTLPLFKGLPTQIRPSHPISDMAQSTINHDSLISINIGNAGLGRIVACLPGNTHLRRIL